MNEEALNLSIRKFLKSVGISSQREIEHAVAKAERMGHRPAVTGPTADTEGFILPAR